MAENMVKKLEKAARKSKDLTASAQEIGYSSQTTGLLAEGDPLDEVDPSGAFSRNLFGLELEAVSPPIFTYQGVGIVQLQRIEDPRPAAYDDVEDEVREEVIEKKKKEKARQKMLQVKREFQAGDVERVAEKHDLELKTSEEHIRGQYLYMIGESPEVDQLAFSLPLNRVSDPVEFESGYALIKILDRKTVDREDFKEIEVEETEKYLEEQKNKFFQSYLYDLREKKGVKIKYNLFQKINTEILASFGAEE
jgi:parvulin-like peptidyl-prolyl isomerase